MKIKAEYIITTIGIILSIMSIYLINNYFKTGKYLRKSQPTSIKIVTTDNRLADNITSLTITSVTTSAPTTTTTTTKIVTTTTTTSPILSLGSEIVFDGLNKEELTSRLNKNLYDTMSNTGIYFSEYTIKTGLDPYLAVAIINLETGCKWGCSSLVKNNYNIGGLKGSDGYLSFSTLEEGIDSYLDILYNKYWSQGLTTPELMNPKYAASSEWATKVNNYINAIKNS